jgi:small nuclear ribonucleoprotein (snRNP)-like protein
MYNSLFNIIYTIYMVYFFLEQLMVMLRDGRTLIAFLRSLDQFGM